MYSTTVSVVYFAPQFETILVKLTIYIGILHDMKRYIETLLEQKNLMQVHDFTNEELDFIIDYDIKYRMGDDLFEGDEGDD